MSPRASYDPDAALGGREAELERLERQAEIAWGEEARLLSELGIGEAASVLDVGCGSGASLERIASLAPRAELIGVDRDPAMLAQARARPALTHTRFYEGDAAALPLDDGSVDFVLARFVLQHLRDPVGALREVRRVLTDGGTVAAIEVDGELFGIVEPRVPGLDSIHAKVWRSQSDRGGDRFIGRRLWRLLAEAGFEAPSLRPYAYHSDALGLDAFAPILSAESIAPSLADGTITPREFAAVAAGYRRFRETPGAFVMLIGLLGCARAPAQGAPVCS